AYPDPTYPLLEPLCRIYECEPAPHPLTAEWELPDSFAGDAAPLKFLVNPNSPTGTWLGRQAVRQVVACSSGVVVIDEAYVDFAVAERAWLAGQLRQRGFEVAPSATNFLFARPPAAHDAGHLHAGLGDRRILVRHYEKDPIAGWLRITVGTREQHETLLEALE